MGSFEEILVKKHLKRTKARVMILKVLEKSLPLTAGEVYEAVRGKDMRLSLSTVYRNCEALAENGLLLRSTMLADGLIRYEYAHGTPSHHAVCLSCHRVFPGRRRTAVRLRRSPRRRIWLRSSRTKSRNLRLLPRLPCYRKRQSIQRKTQKRKRLTNRDRRNPVFFCCENAGIRR